MIAGRVKFGKATGYKHAIKFKIAENCNISNDMNYCEVQYRKLQDF
jgi:hypothetical protein